MQCLPELRVLAHAVAVAANRDQMTVADEPIDEGRCHRLVAEDLAPVLEAFIGREHGGRVLIPARHQLKEEHRACPADGKVADLVDHEQRRMREDLQPRL
jgi:hypothetical protein